jgi:hypothetical protein
MNNRDDVAVRFAQDIAQHQLTIIRDDGVYRHLRFARPGIYSYSFEIITWPGYLAYVGDMGDYVFSRLVDMLEFFRQPTINPGYWAEKIQAGGHEGIKEYSEDKARAWVQQQLDDYEAGDDYRSEATSFSYDDERALRDELEASNFRGYSDAWEADFKDYTFHYLWCCNALVWAVKQYDNAKATA